MSYYLSPAKINLYLHIKGRRSDGYHLIESIFSLINLFDVLEIKTTFNNEINLISSNQEIATQDNLILKAAHMLKNKTGSKYGANITLNKNIPIGAGLGGGSSNAATTLVALNYLWQTHLSISELREIGLELGADIPFFILGENALVSGIGEILTPIKLAKSYYVIVFPNISISTKKIFQALALTQNKSTGIISRLCDGTKNDLQTTAFRLYPEMEIVSQLLAPFGNPVMTGSGSAMFIAAQNKEQALLIKKQLPGDFKVYCVESLAQHPLNGLKKPMGI
ncbi:MAG: 4-(cytidine 5'-diphospho)-2-C-methyl-D-erythritol kinase [Neisseriaceae bacterium]|nr:MAG: 4-(cytidine 5'-diphospho)-2-C-methyl-D-erythritol kinase [Neisseriaceae bacterium]